MSLAVAYIAIKYTCSLHLSLKMFKEQLPGYFYTIPKHFKFGSDRLGIEFVKQVGEWHLCLTNGSPEVSACSNANRVFIVNMQRYIITLFIHPFLGTHGGSPVLELP